MIVDDADCHLLCRETWTVCVSFKGHPSAACGIILAEHRVSSHVSRMSFFFFFFFFQPPLSPSSMSLTQHTQPAHTCVISFQLTSLHAAHFSTLVVFAVVVVVIEHRLSTRDSFNHSAIMNVCLGGLFTATTKLHLICKSVPPWWSLMVCAGATSADDDGGGGSGGGGCLQSSHGKV